LPIYNLEVQEYEFNKKIMGCELEVSIISDSEKEAKKKFEECFKLGEKYENFFSRFKKDSELSTLNKKKFLQVPELF
jgi:thiamine biosynthesis lipoprotein ApbE